MLREEINKIDEELVKLFFKRMEVVCKIADYKIKNSMAVLDRDREEQIINRYLQGIEDEAKRDELRDFLEGLMSISRKAQKKIIDEYSSCNAKEEANYE